jgi:hypothetical protein
VDTRAGLDDVEKGKFFTLQGLQLGPLGRLARSKSLYRLSYPGSMHIIDTHDTIVHPNTYIGRNRATIYIYKMMKMVKTHCYCRNKYAALLIMKQNFEIHRHGGV